MLKKVSFVCAAVMALSLTACGSGDDSTAAVDSAAESAVGTAVTAAAEYSEPEQSPAAHKTGDEMFLQYPSNTVVSTSNNNWVSKAESTTFRAYFPVEAAGELEYCFYISNEIDSTYSNGKPIHVGAEAGDYTIESARIADGGTSPDDEIGEFTDVTFGGEAGTEVKWGDHLWSDPVSFSVEEGHYLVWEWTLTGKHIPAISMSNLTSCTSSEDGGDFVYCDTVPLPQIIGAKRETKNNIIAIGDSITQGCMTEYMKYESWSMQISQKLGSEYSFGNNGLGYSRASDAATDGDWLERTKYADVAIVAFGTNDLISGEYGGDGGNTAEELDGYVRQIVEPLKAAGCEVIVFNAPPQDYKEDREKIRTDYNEQLKATCTELGAYYFDFASYLCDPETPEAAKYGDHPDGVAGGIVSDAFVEKYSVLLGR